jgi:hypothetical protein
LLLTPGQQCPKHDVKLENSSPTVASEEDAEFSNWVTVETYADDTTARACRLRLESEGIPTRLENERMGSRSMYAVATGGVGLSVPAENLADARVILAQDWSIPPADDQIDGEDDDEWDEPAADDASERRRRGMKAVIWLLLTPALAGIVAVCIALIYLVFYGVARLLGW